MKIYILLLSIIANMETGALEYDDFNNINP
jgi:hypothetical protein